MSLDQLTKQTEDLAIEIRTLDPSIPVADALKHAAAIMRAGSQVDSGRALENVFANLPQRTQEIWQELIAQRQAAGPERAAAPQTETPATDLGGDLISQSDEKEEARISFGKKIRNADLHPDVKEQELKRFPEYWREFEETTPPSLSEQDQFGVATATFLASSFNVFLTGKKFPGIELESENFTKFDAWVWANSGGSLVVREALQGTRDILLQEANDRGLTFFAFTQDPGFDGFFEQVKERSGGALSRLAAIAKDRQEAQKDAWDAYVRKNYVQPFLDRAATSTEANRTKFEGRAAAVESAIDPIFEDYRAALDSGLVSSPGEYFTLKPDAGSYLSFDQPPPARGGFSTISLQRTAEARSTEARELANEREDFMRTLNDDYLQEIENQALQDPENALFHGNRLATLVGAADSLWLNYLDFKANPGSVVHLDPDQEGVDTAEIDTSIDAYFARPEVAGILTGNIDSNIVSVAPLRQAQINLLGAQRNRDTLTAQRGFDEFIQTTFRDPLGQRILDEDNLEERNRLIDFSGDISPENLGALSNEYLDAFKNDPTLTPGSFFEANPGHAEVLKGGEVETFIPSLSLVQTNTQTRNLQPEATEQGRRDAITALHEFDPNFDLDAALASVDANPTISVADVARQGQGVFRDEEEERERLATIDAAAAASEQLAQFAGGAQVIEHDGIVHSVGAGDVFGASEIQGIARLFDPDREGGFTLLGLQESLIGLQPGGVSGRTVGSLAGREGRIASLIEQAGRNRGLDPTASITDTGLLQEIGQEITGTLFRAELLDKQVPDDYTPQVVPTPKPPPDRLPRSRVH